MRKVGAAMGTAGVATARADATMLSRRWRWLAWRGEGEGRRDDGRRDNAGAARATADSQRDNAGAAATADAARATAAAAMAMAGWVSLGGHRGPVVVRAAVPVSRCGVVSDEVAGLGAFHVLTSSLLPRLHGVS